jgi:phenylpyruvate tautomerase PptA (4-oxalocrotonate tautomerase family)
MPLIAVRTSLTLDDNQKETIKSGLGKAIALLPGKSEPVLMVDISDGHTMYWAGEKRELAHVDLRMMGVSDFSNKAEFTLAIYQLFHETLGLQNDEVFVFINERTSWGGMGEYHELDAE